MKGIKRVVITILILICSVCFVFGLSACQQGSQGEQGLQGIQGEQGEQGVQGETGKSAYQIWLDNGHIGTETDFLKWLKGGKGEQGEQGIQGEQGEQGVQGETGKSAYQIWLDNGNNGSETDFLNWLKGGKGEQGEQGIQGISIVSSYIDDNGNLIVVLSNGAEINAGNIVAKNPVLDENNKIIFKTLSVTNNTVYGKVSNQTEYFYFTEEIELKGNAGYAVYTDISGTNLVPTKVVNLSVGDNTFYILETCGNDSRLYTVTIRRKPIYTVEFNTNYTQTAPNQLVEEDSFAVEPEIDYPGYDVSWDYDFSNPITQDTTISATWLAIFTVNANEITALTDYGKTLTNITIPAEIDGTKIDSFSAEVFKNNKNISEVVIPSGITQMPTDAFRGCGSLTTITIPESVTRIAGLGDCPSLARVNYLGNINSWAQIGILEAKGQPPFANNSAGLYINDSLITNANITTATKISRYAFSDYKYLTNINIGSSVTSIGRCAFYGCSNLTSVTIPDSVTSIERSAFYECSSLTSIKLPSGITRIENYTFYGCNKLNTIILPNSITQVADYAFYRHYDTYLYRKIFFNGTKNEWSKINTGNHNHWWNIYYYTETPTLNESGTDYDDNYWHYLNGEPTIWVYNKED